MEKPLKILFNTYPVAFDCPGGGEVQLLECRAALERKGAEVVLYDQWNPQFDEVDIVHFFSVQGGSIPFCTHAKNHGKKLAVSPIIWFGENKYDYALGEIGELLNLCDIALPNSFAEGERLSRWYDLPIEKFSPIVNGVDERFFVPGDPELFRTTYDLNEPFLLCVANIELRKNQLNLIRATVGLGIKVVLLGRVRDAEYWQSCQAEMHDGIKFLGHVDYASEMHRSAYAACSAFLLPTRLETPGLAALEAAATGTPLCLTQEGCTMEYFGNLAIYVDPESPESIRSGIVAVASRDRSKDLSCLVKSKYTWDCAAEQLIAAYRKICNKGEI
jgi:glycosyltransferase involved in cell wall biosynthesis